ncbi:hypothetical protein TNCV_273311 [Trichonephila clavipes]|nr:hypothetical protein TNCV_273311 [Trichonephila clavipes]
MLSVVFHGVAFTVASGLANGKPSRTIQTMHTLDNRHVEFSEGTSSHNVERVRVAVEQDRRLTVRELEDEIRIPKSTVWRILTENLGMTRV